MLEATEIRVGNVIRVDGQICKVLSQEIRGTGKFGKTVHVKLKSLEDGNIHEKSFRAEDRAEDVAVSRVKMQYLYEDKGDFVFMNTETYEQFPISGKVVGKHKVFLKEGLEIDILFGEGKALNIEFPKIVELTVITAPPGAGDRETYREIELENGLKVLAPPFVKEGEKIRLNTEDLSYMDRVTTKSMKSAKPSDDKSRSS